MLIKQIIPQEFCLKCLGCCRFSQQESIWSPHLLEEEVGTQHIAFHVGAQHAVPQKGKTIVKNCIPQHVGARHAVPLNPEQDNFVCSCLNLSDNKCKIYVNRPFECQFYPFLFDRKNDKFFLALDTNCVYVRGNKNDPKFKEYTSNLIELVQTQKYLDILKHNPQLFQDYPGVLDLVEFAGAQHIAFHVGARHAVPQKSETSHHRRSIRLKGYDYSQNGAYFITICARNKECLFGEICDRATCCVLTNAGKIVEQCWKEIPRHYPNVLLDEFVVMPNHVHGIINIVGARHAVPLRIEQFGKPVVGFISTIIRSYKSAVTKRINKTCGILGMDVWQRNYYEHIIRDEQSLEKIREYINNNLYGWEQDELFCKMT